MNRVAIIPARGGSKRIPRKNIRAFCGKPMIAWSIEIARVAGIFDSVLVSTDDEEIASVARNHGADVPFMRPADLADDFTGTNAVIAHAVNWLLEHGESPDSICCIYATAPFMEASDLRRGRELLESGKYRYVFSATEYAAPVFRSFRNRKDGGVEMFFPEHLMTRSQDLPTALHDAAQFYWGTRQAWLEEAPIFDPKSHAMQIPRWRVQDIDSEDDWKRAELLWQVLKH